jgi:hypothetical protein
MFSISKILEMFNNLDLPAGNNIDLLPAGSLCHHLCTYALKYWQRKGAGLKVD